jgi:cupin fold WbuC family metalloprotein
MSDAKRVDRRLLEELTGRAVSSPRRRANHNLHESLSDPVQRFLNALEPGTYARPHRHGQGRWELFAVLSGAVAVLLFDELGRVRERVEISPCGPTIVVEVPAGDWHTVASLAPGTVLFELKPGPYAATTDKDFAAWAPAEGSGEVERIEAWFRTAQTGDGPPEASCPPPTPCGS